MVTWVRNKYVKRHLYSISSRHQRLWNDILQSSNNIDRCMSSCSNYSLAWAGPVGYIEDSVIQRWPGWRNLVPYDSKFSVVLWRVSWGFLLSNKPKKSEATTQNVSYSFTWSWRRINHTLFLTAVTQDRFYYSLWKCQMQQDGQHQTRQELLRPNKTSD